jgi:hypothetical protein
MVGPALTPPLPAITPGGAGGGGGGGVFGGGGAAAGYAAWAGAGGGGGGASWASPDATEVVMQSGVQAGDDVITVEPIPR